MIGLASVADAKTQENVYSPEQGIICDKKTNTLLQEKRQF